MPTAAVVASGRTRPTIPGADRRGKTVSHGCGNGIAQRSKGAGWRSARPAYGLSWSAQRAAESRAAPCGARTRNDVSASNPIRARCRVGSSRHAR